MAHITQLTNESSHSYHRRLQRHIPDDYVKETLKHPTHIQPGKQDETCEYHHGGLLAKLAVVVVVGGITWASAGIVTAAIAAGGAGVIITTFFKRK